MLLPLKQHNRCWIQSAWCIAQWGEKPRQNSSSFWDGGFSGYWLVKVYGVLTKELSWKGVLHWFSGSFNSNDYKSTCCVMQCLLPVLYSLIMATATARPCWFFSIRYYLIVRWNLKKECSLCTETANHNLTWLLSDAQTETVGVFKDYWGCWPHPGASWHSSSCCQER